MDASTRYGWEPPATKAGRDAQALIEDIDRLAPELLADYEEHYERVREETEAEMDRDFAEFGRWLDWAESELREAFGR